MTSATSCIAVHTPVFCAQEGSYPVSVLIGEMARAKGLEPRWALVVVVDRPKRGTSPGSALRRLDRTFSAAICMRNAISIVVGNGIFNSCVFT